VSARHRTLGVVVSARHRTVALALALALGTTLRARQALADEAGAGPSPEARGLSGFGQEQAVALAFLRNRDVIAARLEIRAAELDQVQARLYPNPVFSYQVGNLVLGAGNAGDGAPAHPGFFSQPVQSIGLSEVIDIWAKRSAHIKAAEQNLALRRLQVEDALREIVYSVRSAFSEVKREEAERLLSYDMRERYEQTVRLSRARFAAGDISEAELRKIELEGLRYQQGVVDADTQHELARQRLALLLGLPSAAALPAPLGDEPAPRPVPPVAALTAQALQVRPDLLAVRSASAYATALTSAARRDALPDIALGVTYTHSAFTVSGDNPNALALGISLPLPLFDRNQANIGRAELSSLHAQNDTARLELRVRQEVAEARSAAERAESLLALFNQGGMLDRAERALRTAEKSYAVGTISLLELLEAQRTFIETRAQYLRAQYDQRKSRVDLIHAVGSTQP
jgi:cobalt-zinc-cadmium efflux system outer membrane protein